MPSIAEGLSWVTALALTLVGALAVRQWYRERNPASAALAVALASIAVVSLIGRVGQLIGTTAITSAITIVAFALSGYALLEYRFRVIGLSRSLRALAAIATVAATSFVLVVGLGDAEGSPARQIPILVLVGVWSGCVLPSAVGFFRHARRRAPVEEARLRLLGAGYVGIVGVLVVSVFAGQLVQREPWISVSRTVTLGLVGVLYLAVEPPRWLRRRWLRMASARLARAAAPVGAWYRDLPSGIVVGSEGFYEIFGISSVSGNGLEALMDRIHPEDVDRVQEATRIQLEDHVGQAVDYRIVRPDGEVRWVHARGEVVRDPTSEKVVGLFGTTQDITDRKEAEAAQIRAAEERKHFEAMARQTRLESVGQLAGGIAHDFNNLLAGISIYTRLVESRISGHQNNLEMQEDIQAILDDLSQIDRARERASSLIHQLLVFSRKEVVKPQVLHPNDVVRGLEDLLRRTLGEHIRLTIRLAAQVPHIEIDPGHAEQVLMNLAVNARDAMPTGGTLLIETTDAVFADPTTGPSGIQPGEYVCLTVSDTGSGMSREVAAQAFEPFYTTKVKGEGTGLGLAMVYGIVTQAGGQARIYSEPGIGTTVKVYFPAAGAPPSSEGEEETEGPQSVAAGETILLVEDEELVREPVARFLAEQGYHVLKADGPEEALHLAAEHADGINLLLTDVIMPGMTGKELAEKISRTRPSISVVYMSGYSHDVIVHQGAVEAGVVLIEKPFSVQQLLQVVRGVMEQAT